MLSTTALAIALFVSTNIDDIFILLAFFVDRRFRLRQIVIGQYLGIAVLVGISLVASLISLVLPASYIGLLGLIPIWMGLRQLIALAKGSTDDDDPAPKKFGASNILAVAAVTIANGGDNIGVYTPIFATSTFADLVLIAAVFAILTGVLLVLAQWMVNHPAMGVAIRKFAPVVVPLVLIGVGGWVLWEAGTVSLFRNMP